jgi:hypothetical protein
LAKTVAVEDSEVVLKAGSSSFNASAISDGAAACNCVASNVVVGVGVVKSLALNRDDAVTVTVSKVPSALEFPPSELFAAWVSGGELTVCARTGVSGPAIAPSSDSPICGTVRRDASASDLNDTVMIPPFSSS